MTADDERNLAGLQAASEAAEESAMETLLEKCHELAALALETGEYEESDVDDLADSILRCIQNWHESDE